MPAQSPDILAQLRVDTLKTGTRVLKTPQWNLWRNPLPDRSQASPHPMVSFINEEYKYAAEDAQKQKLHNQARGGWATQYHERNEQKTNVLNSMQVLATAQYSKDPQEIVAGVAAAIDMAQRASKDYKSSANSGLAGLHKNNAFGLETEFRTIALAATPENSVETMDLIGGLLTKINNAITVAQNTNQLERANSLTLPRGDIERWKQNQQRAWNFAATAARLNHRE